MSPRWQPPWGRQHGRDSRIVPSAYASLVLRSHRMADPPADPPAVMRRLGVLPRGRDVTEPLTQERPRAGPLTRSRVDPPSRRLSP